MRKMNLSTFDLYQHDVFYLVKYFTKSQKRTVTVLKNLRSFIDDQTALVTGHIIDDKLVSFIWCYIKSFGGNERIHISYFIVDENYRGRGLSNDLISFAIKMAVEKEIKQIDLNVEPDNQGAIDLYHRAGFYTEKLQLVMEINEVDKNV